MSIEEDICRIGLKMYNRGLVASNDGNISVRLGDTVFVTPTLTSKGEMVVDNIVRMDLYGKMISGGKPTSEYRMHLAVYNKRADIGAVVHAHPVYASAFAITGRAVTQRYMPEAVLTLGVIPVAPYAKPGTDEVPESIKPFIDNHNGVLLSNHGALTWGKTLLDAYNLMEQLEFYCHTVVVAEAIGKPRSI